MSDAAEQDPGRKVVQVEERDGGGRVRWSYEREERDGGAVFVVGFHLDYSPRTVPGEWTRWRCYADGTEEQIKPGETIRGPNGGW